MGFVRVILLFIFLACCSLSEAYNFIIGGRNGWYLLPSENYSKWANRMRFQVNDTLTFKYSKETDSVVVVTKHDYEKCNAAKPVLKMDGGDSVFKFDRSGPFYFITANKSNCHHGQKLIIVVLAVRNKPPSPTPSAPAPSPGINVPVPAVSPPPVIPSPADSPAPVISGPAVSPAPGTSDTPSPSSPGNAPAADILSTPAPAPSKSFAPAIRPAMLVTVVAAFITFA